MTKFTLNRRALASASLYALALGVAAPAAAQVSDSPVESDSADFTEEEEIVITGTLLRGVAPVGTNVVNVTSEDVVATGAASTNDLLAVIPQLSNFNSFPTGTASFGRPIAQTSLRGLGGAGGSTTLVLLNGHRLVGAGILQTYVDPTIIPPGIIERVEVIPDGGSSIYGSDAVGGVINFITRKRVDGIDARARYGFADGYDTVDANVTAGEDWGSGSASVSYAYAWHNNIQGIERDYVSQDGSSRGGTDRRVTTCRDTNIVAAGVNYAMPGLVPGTQNRCDSTDYADIYPREERHTVFGTLDQDIGTNVVANLTAYWSTRSTNSMTGPLSTNGVITDANPYFQPIGDETSQRVLFNYTSVFGDRGTDNPAKFSSWGVTPTLTWDIGSGWDVRAMANYGRSYNRTHENAINASAAADALAATTIAEALNPYDLSETSPSVLANIRDYANISVSEQEIAEGRLVADGRLFSLPGGDVRLAVGGEYHYENVDARIAFGPRATPKRNAVFASRDVVSVFGEVFVPIVGPGNAMPGIAALELTASARHDRYSDVGSTTNPKVGFNYRPVDWITFRGNYGTSFHAPSLADTEGAVDERVTLVATSNNRAPGSPPSDALRPFLFISGGNPDLKPETAKTWSLGTEINPEFLSGLNISLTYYNIDFTDTIAVNSGVFTGGQSYFTDPTNEPYYILDPTLEQAIAFARGARADNFDSLAEVFATSDPYAIYDVRRYNRGRLKLDGIDFNVSFTHPTSFGSVSASFAGTYALSRKTSDSNNGVYVDRLKNGFNRLNFVAWAGAEVGAVTSRVTVTHSGSYPIIGEPLQPRVKSYSPVDLYFELDLEKVGLLRESSLTLNIDNVFDDDPPFRNAGSGYANGSTLGRLIAFGVRTKF